MTNVANMPHSSEQNTFILTVFLRKFTVFSIFPAFLLLLIHGIISNHSFPALTLIPLAASSLLGASLIYRNQIAAIGSPIQALSPSNVFFADILLSISLLIFLIPSWVMLESDWGRAGHIMLGTYGSVFPMANLAIHIYFSLAELLHLITANQCNCPHCQSVTFRGGKTFQSLASEYTPLSSDIDRYQDEMPRDVEAQGEGAS